MVSESGSEVDKVIRDVRIREILQRAIEVQKRKESQGRDGWEWHEVRAPPQTLNHLVTLGMIDIVFKSNKSTIYRVNDVERLEGMLADAGNEPPPEIPLPTDLFDCIILHDDKKELVDRILHAQRPTHCLFVGEVASSKTLFLQELARLPGAEYLLGSSLSRAGLYELMFEHRPKYLLIDEIDKIRDYENISALLSLMETGILSETKYKRRRIAQFDTWVFAGCNDETRIPPEILSRFGAYRLHFRPYTDQEFREVATKVLVLREGLDDDVAKYITEQVMERLYTHDVRVARSIARTSRTKEEVDSVLAILARQTT